MKLRYFPQCIPHYVQICDKNVSNEKYEKLRNSLFNIKNWIKLFLETALRFNKRAPLFDKKALGLSEGQLEVESPLTRSCFWHFWFKSRKTIFPKKSTFNEASDPLTLYLSKVGPGMPMLYYIMSKPICALLHNTGWFR